MATAKLTEVDNLDAFAALLLTDAEDDYDSLIALALADLANASCPSIECGPKTPVGVHIGVWLLRSSQMLRRGWDGL